MLFELRTKNQQVATKKFLRIFRVTVWLSLSSEAASFSFQNDTKRKSKCSIMKHLKHETTSGKSVSCAMCLSSEKAEKNNIKNNQNVPKFPQGKLNIFPRGLGNWKSRLFRKRLGGFLRLIWRTLYQVREYFPNLQKSLKGPHHPICLSCKKEEKMLRKHR